MTTFKFRELALLERLLGMERGYVLDFSNRTFAQFFADEDIEIYASKYGFKGTSKADHIRGFWETEPDHVVGRVLASLIEHHVPETDRNQELRRKCCEIAARLQASGGPGLDRLVDIARVENLSQLQDQIARMRDKAGEDPDLAIGTAKEIVETVCKTILRDSGGSLPRDPKMPALLKATLKELELVPDSIPESKRGKDTVKRVLGSLGSIGHGLAELRNLYGTGHGRHGASGGLQPRHARLAVGAMATLAVFLFETHEARKTEGSSPPTSGEKK